MEKFNVDFPLGGEEEPMPREQSSILIII